MRQSRLVGNVAVDVGVLILAGVIHAAAMLPVTLHALSKSYDGRTRVLDEVSVQIAAGEMFFLLGGSGCGKTTLLRLVAGFLRPDAGEIRFGDQDVTRLPPEERGIGMVFQNYALWPHLTVGENIAFGLDVRRVPAAEKSKRVEEALDLVELPGLAQRRVAELSGGQQQRVALARAVVIKPRLLLLDEPLSNLDARLRTQMRGEIRRVCKAAGATAIYVTHDQQEALSTADRIAVLAGGRVAQVATPRELYERPADRLVAEFIGEANLLPATLAGRGRATTALGDIGFLAIDSGVAAGAAVTLCIRPERLRLSPIGTPLGMVPPQDNVPALAGRESPADNHFEASVVSGSYLGASARWTLAARGAAGVVRLLAEESDPPQRSPGDQVHVRVDPSHVTVLRH